MEKDSLFYRVELFITRRRAYFISGLIFFMLIFPFFGFSVYIMRIATVIYIFSMLTLALNLVAGYTGQLSMGNAAFYAIGAYTCTLFMVRLGMNFWASMVIGAVFAGASGLVVGLPTLRLSGSYLTIVTLGFGEIVRMVIQNWDLVTNGTLGIRNIPKPVFFGLTLTLSNNGFYYLAVALLLIISFFCAFIINSKIGRAFVAIREDEIAATMMGIKTTRYKVLAFFLSALISGIAGAFYAPMVGYIDPNTFTFDVSSQIICLAILGGLGTMRGMFFGSIVLIVFPEVSRFLMNYRFILYGLILVLMMRFRSQGLLGWQSRAPYRFARNTRKDLEKNNLLTE
jgi:branched-chain amino acid transport system permease protein